MYLGIDIGGTKTLLAVFNDDGSMVESQKFPTPNAYDDFLKELTGNLTQLKTKSFERCAIGVPGNLNREQGIALALGNLPWRNVTLRDDVQAIVTSPTLIENDANLAGLAEAKMLVGRYTKVLYVTVSTGIGGTLYQNDEMIRALEDMEMGKMPLPFEGRIAYWENFAGGRSIVDRYKKMASELDDPKAWHEIAERLGYGLAIVCSILQPDAIVFGGGAGQYAEKFIPHLQAYLKENLHVVVNPPQAMFPAHYKDQSVIVGCYQLARLGHEEIIG